MVFHKVRPLKIDIVYLFKRNLKQQIHNMFHSLSLTALQIVMDVAAFKEQYEEEHGSITKEAIVKKYKTALALSERAEAGRDCDDNYSDTMVANAVRIREKMRAAPKIMTMIIAQFEKMGQAYILNSVEKLRIFFTKVNGEVEIADWVLGALDVTVLRGTMPETATPRELVRNPKNGTPGIFELHLYTKMILTTVFAWMRAQIDPAYNESWPASLTPGLPSRNRTPQKGSAQHIVMLHKGAHMATTFWVVCCVGGVGLV